MRIIVPAAGTAPVDLVMTTDLPGWFRRTVENHLMFWVEITYGDVGAVET